MGCQGGYATQAFSYMKGSGITTQQLYPYIGYDQQCRIAGGPRKIINYIRPMGCNEILDALTAKPVAVAVDAANWSTYRSGIFSNCGNHINHFLLAIGATDTYWKLKNSWGMSWGEMGTIRIGPGNTCGVCTEGSYPVF